MNYGFKKIVSMFFVLNVLGGVSSLVSTDDTPEDWYGIEGSRSYHGATYNTVTGQEEHPFMFTTSILGRAVRATSFLLDCFYDAAENESVRQNLLENMDEFCEKILNLYVLCHEAQRFVQKQLQESPEKTAYLVEELEHLRRKIFLLAENFKMLTENLETPEIITIMITLKTIAKKTGQMLAV